MMSIGGEGATGSIGTGTGGARLGNKIIGGATSTSCFPNFFCNLQLKVTLVCKVTFNRKILESSPPSGALPQTPLYTAYTFFGKIHIA